MIRVKQWNTTCSAVIGLCPSDICSMLQAQSSDFGGDTLLIPLLMPSVISIFFRKMKINKQESGDNDFSFS